MISSEALRRPDNDASTAPYGSLLVEIGHIPPIIPKSETKMGQPGSLRQRNSAITLSDFLLCLLRLTVLVMPRDLILDPCHISRSMTNDSA